MRRKHTATYIGMLLFNLAWFSDTKGVITDRILNGKSILTKEYYLIIRYI